MNIDDVIREALAEYLLSERYVEEPITVDEYYDEIRRGGFCSTCFYEEMVIVVKYHGADGKSRSLVLHKTLAELIQALSE